MKKSPPKTDFLLDERPSLAPAEADPLPAALAAAEETREALGVTVAAPFRCPRCERVGVRAAGVVAPMCEACKTAWGVK